MEIRRVLDSGSIETSPTPSAYPFNIVEPIEWAYRFIVR